MSLSDNPCVSFSYGVSTSSLPFEEKTQIEFILELLDNSSFISIQKSIPAPVLPAKMTGHVKTLWMGIILVGASLNGLEVTVNWVSVRRQVRLIMKQFVSHSILALVFPVQYILVFFLLKYNKNLIHLEIYGPQLFPVFTLRY